MGNRPNTGKAHIMHESTSWEHYAEESLTHDDYGTRPPLVGYQTDPPSKVPQTGYADPLTLGEAAGTLYVSYHGHAPIEIEIPMFFQTGLRSDGEWPK
jgi:hypothetical protein